MLRSVSASTSAVSPTIRAPRAAILTPRVQLVLALGAVYIIWGSTYLAMRWAVEGIPPLFMGAARFLIAGAVLLTVARLRGVPMPTAREWRGATIVGGLFFLGGNGLVAIAERDLGSGIAAVVCATMPVWLAVMASIAGERPRPLEWLGLGTGLIGVVVLTGGADVRAAPFATAVLVLSPISWALGSLLSRKVALPRGLAAAGAEMLAGGALLAVAGIAHGERIPTDPPTSALLAVVYLIVAGSLIGFTAYAWLLRNARPAVATSYAFVNPALALVLGAVLGAETIGPATLAGTALIIVAVAVIVLAPRRAA